jgi:F-type H+-transporting ATPase subunit epsilon
MAIPSDIALDIVTPARAVVRERVDEVQIPGVAGHLGVLVRHTPLMTLLDVGRLWYRKGLERYFLFVAFGFVEVLPDRVTVLAEIVERAEEIDVARAERARLAAQERLSKATLEVDREQARTDLLKAQTRLQVAQAARATA